MRQSFVNNLNELQKDLVNMGKMVDSALEKSVESLTSKNFTLAKSVIADDEQIDDLQIKIEDKSLMLIALQQPIAKDLRVLSTALKIITDLERMGDHAKNISEVALEIGDQPLIKPLVHIPNMLEKTRIMLKDSLTAYIEMDVPLAEAVCKADDEVDDMCDYVLRELLTYMIKDNSTINQASQLLYVTRCLERVGDHATNIAECVSYLVTGNRLKGN